MMPEDLGTALIAVGGVALGATITYANEWRKARFRSKDAYQAEYRQELRAACATHASNLVQYVSAAREAGPNANPDQRAEIDRLQNQSRVSTEVIRLLASSSPLQEAGRLALRHAWAIKETAAGRTDPRPDTRRPSKRFDDEFRNFLVEARRELGLNNPEDVYAAT
jgi:hypothetical protein